MTPCEDGTACLFQHSWSAVSESVVGLPRHGLTVAGAMAMVLAGRAEVAERRPAAGRRGPPATAKAIAPRTSFVATRSRTAARRPERAFRESPRQARRFASRSGSSVGATASRKPSDAITTPDMRQRRRRLSASARWTPDHSMPACSTAGPAPAGAALATAPALAAKDSAAAYRPPRRLAPAPAFVSEATKRSRSANERVPPPESPEPDPGLAPLSAARRAESRRRGLWRRGRPPGGWDRRRTRPRCGGSPQRTGSRPASPARTT